MTEDRFERELRDFLMGRAPASAPAGLRARVGAVSLTEPTAVPGWRRRSVVAWGGAVRLVAAAAVAILVIALVSRLNESTAPAPESVGAPSQPPVPGGSPFVAAPDGFFTARALADAQVRLGRVFTETGVEATFIVQPASAIDELVTPADWPDAYDRDHDPRRDVTAVAGITPDRRIVCCLTITGASLEQARRYWQPFLQPSSLDGDLSGATAESRDLALGRFVQGIEQLAASVTQFGVGPDPGGALVESTPLILLVGIGVLIVAALPWRRRTLATETGASAISLDIAAIDDETRESAAPAAAKAVDRGPLFLALGAIGAIAIGTAIDVLRPRDPTVHLDPAGSTEGMAGPGTVLVPAVLVAIAVISLLAYALQGGWRRRLAILAAIVMIGASSVIALQASRPASRDVDVSWASSPNIADQSRVLDGLTDTLTYHLRPDETVTLAGIVRNPGVLPVTIVGLDAVRPTGANPHVASIVGLGWVPQPVDDGRVHLLSAQPAATSVAWPITLGPGEEAAVVALVRAGPCAEPAGNGPVLPLTNYTVRYRVLGIERTAVVGLPATAFVTARNECTVDVPGGSITYGPPTTAAPAATP